MEYVIEQEVVNQSNLFIRIPINNWFYGYWVIVGIIVCNFDDIFIFHKKWIDDIYHFLKILFEL